MIMDVTANILLLRHLVSIHFILGKEFVGITPSAFARLGVDEHRQNLF